MTALAHIDAVILAGGLGTRLRSVLDDRPKVLAPVGHRPFLSRLLDQVANSGIATAVLCTGYLADHVTAAFGDTYHNLRIAYSQETEPLGTGGAIRAALSACHSDPVLVMNGDSYCHVELEQLGQAHAATGAGATLVVTRVPDVGRFGSVTFDASGHIRRFEEKATVSGEGWINAGIYLINRSLLDTIPDDRAISLEREIFPRWTDDRMFAFRTAGPFLDIGTPETYAAAERFFA